MLSPGEFSCDPASDVATGEAYGLSPCWSMSLPKTWSVSGSVVSGGLLHWLGVTCFVSLPLRIPSYSFSHCMLL